MNTEAAIEGILFAMGQPVDRCALAAALEIPEEEVCAAAAHLAEACARDDRGLQVITLGDSYQLCTKKECYEPLIRLAARPKKPVLTNVLLETLAIIAYKQPVTKLEIAKIRGVSSDHAVNKLIEYELVCEVGRLEAPGRPILLGTTEEFLRRFCLSSTEDLPELTAEKLAELEEEAERESAETPEQVDVTV
ncbi:MAG: SMC-Scp complex subunit ScpB [Lachnospiraceae bacterium]|nr:SMC-Scp complex subunit ScpB [Lachnospiraceae bacterium]